MTFWDFLEICFSSFWRGLLTIIVTSIVFSIVGDFVVDIIHAVRGVCQ